MGQILRSQEENKSSATAEVADRGWKADLNWKLQVSNSQAKNYVAKVVVATSSEGFLVYHASGIHMCYLYDHLLAFNIMLCVIQ